MKENKFTSWIKAHKTELIFAGGIALTTVGTIFLINNRAAAQSLLEKTEPPLSLPVSGATNLSIVPAVDSLPVLKKVDVREHLRALPQGQHPSMWKLAEAAESGIELAENQTLVSAHPRYCAA